jgi:hypothetical protein
MVLKRKKNDIKFKLMNKIFMLLTKVEQKSIIRKTLVFQKFDSMDRQTDDF